MKTLILSTIVLFAVIITVFSLTQQVAAQNQMGMAMVSPGNSG